MGTLVKYLVKKYEGVYRLRRIGFPPIGSPKVKQMDGYRQGIGKFFGCIWWTHGHAWPRHGLTVGMHAVLFVFACL